jgi:hypothetical protein
MLFYGAVANYWIEVTRNDADLSPSAQRALGDRPSAFAGKGEACRSDKARSAAENEAKSAPSPPPIPGSIHLDGGAAVAGASCSPGGDRRMMRVFLTKKGAQLEKLLGAAIDRVNAKFVNALGKNRAANLWRDLGTIASLPATET